MKKTLAILLSLALVICMLPGAAFADDTIDLSGATITLSNTSVVYNGQKQVPTVTVKVGDTVLEENKDYTLSWDREPKEVGEYTLTVSGSGNYSGSKTGLKFLITKLNLSNSNVSIKEITPVTSVENAKQMLMLLLVRLRFLLASIQLPQKHLVQTKLKLL